MGTANWSAAATGIVIIIKIKKPCIVITIIITIIAFRKRVSFAKISKYTVEKIFPFFSKLFEGFQSPTLVTFSRHIPVDAETSLDHRKRPTRSDQFS